MRVGGGGAGRPQKSHRARFCSVSWCLSSLAKSDFLTFGKRLEEQ